MGNGARRIRHAERGIALAASLFVLALLLLCTVSGLLIGAANVRAADSFRSTAQAHFVAESAIAEALQRVNAGGLVDFQRDVESSWSSIWGATAHVFRPLVGFTYRVTATADAANPANAGRLVATATGPDGESNVVVATVARAVFPATAPGAIHLATDQPATAVFLGSTFFIDGTDRDYAGGPASGSAVAGISTRTDANVQAATAQLTSPQADRIRGLGYQAGSPARPSVAAVLDAPDDTDVDAFVQALLAQPRAPDFATASLTGPTTLGTPDTPDISHFTGPLLVGPTATVSGGGVLIVDGDLDVEGSFDFKGLVLVRGRLSIGTASSLTPPTGTATIYGSVWAQSVAMGPGASALVSYSTHALALATAVAGSTTQPAPLALVALADCSTMPHATGGCP